MGKPFERNVNLLTYPMFQGNIILFDDFESVFKWSGTGTGADFVCEKSNTYPYIGDYSLHLKTRATNPAQNDTVTASRFFSFRTITTFEVGLILLAPTFANIKTIDIDIDVFGITKASYPGMRLNLATNYLQYRNSANTFANASTDQTVLYNAIPYHTRFACNPTTSLWKYIGIGQYQYNLSSEQIYSEEWFDYIGAEVRIKLTAANDQRPEIYVDNFLIQEL